MMVDRVSDAGFNTILVQVRGRGDAMYRSRWEPPSHVLPPDRAGFDPLATVIEMAHARGLAVHGWVNTFLVSSPWILSEDPIHIVNARPDLLAVPLELARELHRMDPEDPAYLRALIDHAQISEEVVEGLYASPSSPEVREHVYSVWMDLLETYPLDGLHFDYVRYPGPGYDFSRSALAAFREWLAPLMPPEEAAVLDEFARLDPLAWVEGRPEAWSEFRRRQVTTLVEQVYLGAKKRRPDLLISAAVFPDAADASENRFQEWGAWLERGIVDVVAPMAYTVEDGIFEEQVRAAIGAAGAEWRVWAGIGAYQNTFVEAARKVEIARRLGAGGVILFSYDWLISEGFAPGGGPYLPAFGRQVFGSGR
jgi:uncharacterized lipoprotein YddW (UPF0748 family)